MEIMFLILSGVILAAGVLYWFWSHIQLTQKKVQLLENAVFELRGMLAPTEIHSEPVPHNQDTLDQPKYRDLEDDDWNDQTQDVRVAVVEATPQEVPLTQTQVIREESVRMTPDLIQSFANMYTEEFREVNAVETTPTNETKVESKVEDSQTLEGMTLKELRRMASERGITGTAEMRKKALVDAIRLSVNGPTEANETELTLEAV